MLEENFASLLYLLDRLVPDAGESYPQAGVTIYKCLETIPQSRHIDYGSDPECSSNVIGSAGRRHLMNEPQRLLTMR